MGRLLKSEKGERDKYIGQIDAYERLYNEFVRELARIRNSEE